MVVTCGWYRFGLPLLISLVLLGCQDSPLPQPQAAPPAPTAQVAGVTAVGPSWPPGMETSESEALADDLLAQNYYVVLDGSGSMKQSQCSGFTTKSVVSKKALAEFAKAVPHTANLGLIAFDHQGVSERVPLGRGPQNRQAFIEQVNQTGASNDTPLKRAMTLGYQQLEAQARRQLGYGEYHLVVVTDGEASQGEAPKAVVQRILTQTPIVIHTIGFCIGENHSLNQRGQIVYKAANNPKELSEGLQGVLAESPVFDVTAFATQ